MEKFTPLINAGFDDFNYLRFLIDLVLMYASIKILFFFYQKKFIALDSVNENKFNWVNFGVGIFLIVSVIQNSLALSLGMVGALSVIRFRTAIKDPGELIFLLLVTGVSISFAASKEIVAFIVICFWVITLQFKKSSLENLETPGMLKITLNNIPLEKRNKIINTINDKYKLKLRNLTSSSKDDSCSLIYENIEILIQQKIEIDLDQNSINYSILRFA